LQSGLFRISKLYTLPAYLNSSFAKVIKSVKHMFSNYNFSYPLIF